MSGAKHIIFLQSAHTCTDDRVLFHQTKTLQRAGHTVEICGMESFANFRAKPADVYIVDTPVAMWKIRCQSAKIIYDITEWYPSKKNLRNIVFGKFAKALILMMASLWAGWRADAFIFGEQSKAKPFRFLFPRKTHIFLPYYPDLQYIHPLPVRDISKLCRVLYAGALTKEKGWDRVLDTMVIAAQQMPETVFQLDVITKDVLPCIPVPCNLEIIQKPFMPFEVFCQQIASYDLFLDLRTMDIENTRCLPIKLFYYMACGRPSIYSNLRAITDGVPDAHTCTSLVNNNDETLAAIQAYVSNPVVYQAHCANALDLSRSKYNWDMIRAELLRLIEQL